MEDATPVKDGEARVLKDDSDDEWEDHVRSGGASFSPRPVDANVGP
jgi:hypothetical protein